MIIPEDNSEHHTRRHENLKSHKGQLYLYNVSFCLLDQTFSEAETWKRAVRFPKTK
jgi:hypothetical protein